MGLRVTHKARLAVEHTAVVELIAVTAGRFAPPGRASFHKVVFQKDGFRPLHVVIGLHPLVRGGKVVDPSFGRGPSFRRREDNTRLVKRRFGIELLQSTRKQSLTGVDVAQHPGIAFDPSRTGNHRTTGDASVILDRYARAGHHGVVFDDGLVQHLGAVQHHAMGADIGGGVHGCTGGDPAPAVGMPCALGIFQQLLGTYRLIDSTYPHSIVCPVPILVGHFREQQFGVFGATYDQIFKGRLHLCVFGRIGRVRPVIASAALAAADRFVRHVFGTFQAPVAVDPYGDVLAAGPAAAELDVVRVVIGEITLQKVGRRPVDFRISDRGQGVGRCHDGEPVAQVAGFARHGHAALVEQRAIAASPHLVHGNDAGAPVAVGVGIKMAAEVHADFLGIGLRDQENVVRAERVRGLGHVAPVQAFFSVQRVHEVAQGRRIKFAETGLHFAIELGKAGPDLAEQIPYAANAVFPQTALLAQTGHGVERRTFRFRRKA